MERTATQLKQLNHKVHYHAFFFQEKSSTMGIISGKYKDENFQKILRLPELFRISYMYF